MMSLKKKTSLKSFKPFGSRNSPRAVPACDPPFLNGQENVFDCNIPPQPNYSTLSDYHDSGPSHLSKSAPSESYMSQYRFALKSQPPKVPARIRNLGNNENNASLYYPTPYFSRSSQQSSMVSYTDTDTASKHCTSTLAVRQRRVRRAAVHLDKSLPPLPGLTNSFSSAEEGEKAPESLKENPLKPSSSITASSPLVHINKDSSNFYMFENMKDFELYTKIHSLPHTAIISEYDPHASIYQFDIESFTPPKSTQAVSNPTEISKRARPKRSKSVKSQKNGTTTKRKKAPTVDKNKIPEEEEVEPCSKILPNFTSTNSVKNEDILSDLENLHSEIHDLELNQYLDTATDLNMYTTQPLRVTSIISKRNSTATSSANGNASTATIGDGLSIVSSLKSKTDDNISIPPLSLQRVSLLSPTMQVSHSYSGSHQASNIADKPIGSKLRQEVLLREVPAIPPRNSSRVNTPDNASMLVSPPLLSAREFMSGPSVPTHVKVPSGSLGSRKEFALGDAPSVHSIRSRRSHASSLEIEIPPRSTNGATSMHGIRRVSVQSAAAGGYSLGSPAERPNSELKQSEDMVQDFISNDLSLLDSAITFDVFEPNLYNPVSIVPNSASTSGSFPCSAFQMMFHENKTATTMNSFVTADTSPSLRGSECSESTVGLSRKISSQYATSPSRSSFSNLSSDRSIVPSPALSVSQAPSVCRSCVSTPSLAVSSVSAAPEVSAASVEQHLPTSSQPKSPSSATQESTWEEPPVVTVIPTNWSSLRQKVSASSKLRFLSLKKRSPSK